MISKIIENRLVELNNQLLNLTGDRIWDSRSSNRREETMMCKNTIKELEEILKKSKKHEN